jgi:hypothetical protein
MTVKKFNMKTSPQKCDYSQTTIQMQTCGSRKHNRINNGNEFLGIRPSSCGNIENEAKKQVTKANKVACCLNDTIWRNKYIRKQAKFRICKAVVRPNMTYRTETRPDTARTQRLLQTTMIKMLRKTAGRTL